MKTQLDWIYEKEEAMGDRLWMTQPMGGGEIRTFTFREGLDQARRMAAHLKGLDLPEASKIGIFSKNCAWWFFADLAIWMSGHVTVPIYPTLAPESIRRILEHAEAKLVFVGKLDGFAAMEPGLAEGVHRIYMPLSDERPGDQWEAIVERTEPIDGNPTRDPDDLATIIYTSGSTGDPKGAMHSFRTMTAAGSYIEAVGLGPEDRVLSYLPLAHVAERALLQTVSFMRGPQIFFAESLDTFVDDLRRARPTVFGSVPRLWVKFQSGIHSKMAPKTLSLLLSIPVVSWFIRRKVLQGLGLDAVRLAMSGSAPLPPDLVDWYDRLGLAIHEAYGMTENFAVSHVETVGEARRKGYVGKPLPGVEHKLSEQGELLVRSPGTMLGYYEADDLTAETIDGDGWLHTGDRGEIDDAGRLKLTGRVKELFKTSKGKYVAPAPIENKLLAHPAIEQACVCGANMSQPTALVVLSPEAKARDRAGTTGELEALIEATNAVLDPHERLLKVVVSKDEWTVENRMLTPTLKLKRGTIEDRYGPELPTWYEAPDPVVWLS